MPNAMEQAGAKVAGKLGGFMASLSGLTGVFRRLAEEHKEVQLLLERASLATDPKKRADLWTSLRAELVAHERAEINHVYVEFLPPSGIDDLGERHEAEADELEALISELDAMDSESSDWPRAVEHLAQAVRNHAAKEESMYFPQLQAAIGETRAKELEALYMQAKLAIIHDLD